jgi:hypothetical protein
VGRKARAGSTPARGTKNYVMISKKDSIEYCVLCGKDTPYHFNDHIDFRYGYVEGVGQLCKNCHDNPEKSNESEVSVLIPENFIKSNSNDQDLGEKIRRIYWKIKDKLS